MTKIYSYFYFYCYSIYSIRINTRISKECITIHCCYDILCTALFKALFHVPLLYFEHLPLQRSLHGPGPVSFMRCSITPPALTASSGLGFALVSSSSVTLETVRAFRERPKDMEDVILVKFVLLVSVHTEFENPSFRSFKVSCFNLFNCFTGCGVHGDQAQRCFQADPAIAILSHTCSPALASRLCDSGGIIMVFLILSVHSGKDSLDVPFPSMIRFSLTTAMRDVMDSRDRSMWAWWSAAELAQLC